MPSVLSKYGLKEYLIAVLLCLAPAKGRSYVPGVQELRLSPEYLFHHPAPDFEVLAPFYRGQQTSSDCSAASLTMIVNAARKHLGLSKARMISESELISRMDDPDFTEAVKEHGPGTNLKRFASLAQRGLDVLGLDGSVTPIWFQDASAANLTVLRKMLQANERSSDDLIVANFDQGLITNDSPVGHFSPVAAYDALTRRALIMDVDCKWVEPYWVPDNLLLKAMAAFDNVHHYHRGLMTFDFD